jgi:Holliday junction resolvase
MSRKSKGIGAERELIHLFWGTNKWSAIRVAGSGSMKYPCPDVVAGNNIRKLAIECKSSKDTNQYLTKEEVSQLKKFSSKFGAEPWIGVRFDKFKWFFMNIEDLKETDKNYVISLESAKSKGLLFEELIEDK